MKDALVLVHGMMTTAKTVDHRAEYDALWRAISSDPTWGARIAAAIGERRCLVEWGHPTADGIDRPDARIEAAELAVHERAAYAQVSTDPSPQNHLHVGSEGAADWLARQTLRPVLRTIKEEVAIYGLTDVVYYCSEDGEAAVRNRVYGTVLACLDAFGCQDGARLHVVGQSLGVTVAFDLLFGLFNTVKEPDFASERYPAPQVDKDRLTRYRALAQAGALSVGSFCTTASQLPLLVMRKQRLVDDLAAGRRIETRQIGIDPDGPPRWRVFYDQDDVLGFPTRRLFDATTALEEYEVNTDWRPDKSHSGYWSDPDVASRIAELVGRGVEEA